MDEQVAVIAALLGVLLAPVVVRAALVVPAYRRPASVDGTPGPTDDASGAVIAPVRASLGLALSGRLGFAVAAVATAAVLAVIGGRLGADPALPAFLAFGVVAVVLAIVDLEHHRLPDVLTLPSYPVGVALLGVASLAGTDSGSLRRALLGALVAFVSFAAMYLGMPAGIGAGDVKYAGVIGLYAGWLGWGSLVVALVGGFVIGAVVSVLLLAARRADRRSRVPFGPSMVAGAVVAIGWGEAIAGVWRGG